MHRTALFLSVAAAVVASIAACSSDVQEAQPGTGGSGAGGSNAGGIGNTGAGATGGIGSGGAGNAGGQGGGASVCEEACAYASACGFDICAQVGLVCDGDAYACEGQCVLDTSCEDLAAFPNAALIACVQGCNGGTGGGGGGPDVEACLGCAEPCVPEGCLQDPSCQSWGLCALNCTDPACFDQCDADNPDAAGQYGPFYECVCAGCDAECGPIMDPCAGSAGGGGVGGSGSGGSAVGGSGGSIN
jgi:hypothetical protein